MKKTTKTSNKFYPLHFETFLTVTVPTAKAALKNIKGVKKLLKNENAWLKDEYITDDKTKFCLIGAVEEVDGPGELIADMIMQQVISGDLVSIGTDYYSTKSEATYSDEHREIEHVQEFNDNDDTTFTDIHEFMDFCISETERLIVYLTKLKEFNKNWNK